MTDIPIIFSAPMVLALLAGHKTMTRRLAHRKAMDKLAHRTIDVPSPWQNVKAGDRLWVRENHWRYGRWVGKKTSGNPSYSFEPLREPSDMPDVICNADAPASFTSGGRGKFGDPVPDWHLRPSIFMPREHSRLTLVVDGVKIEPLQSISEADAIAEGVQLIGPKTWGVPGTGSMVFNGGPVDGFSTLWMSLHSVVGWHDNPEVVALSFKVVEANIDAPEARAA